METQRVTRTKDEAKASYNRLSRFYDVVAGGAERKHTDAGLALLGVREAESILEIGFGTGHALAALAKAVGPGGKVTGIDISVGMTRVARARLSKLGLLSRVELDVGDAARLPYPDASFDAVFMSFSLDLIDTPEIPVVLGECRRVLTPAGRICIVSMTNLGKQGVMSQAYGWSHRKMPKLVDCRPIFAARSLEQAGFEVKSEKRALMWGLPVETVLAKKA